MQTYVLKITLDGDCAELYREMMLSPLGDGRSDLEVYAQFSGPYRGTADVFPAVKDMLVILGSVGAFSALWKIICTYLERNKNRELTIEREGRKVGIKGHNLPEEESLMSRLLQDTIRTKDNEGQEHENW